MTNRTTTSRTALIAAVVLLGSIGALAAGCGKDAPPREAPTADENPAGQPLAGAEASVGDNTPHGAGGPATAKAEAAPQPPKRATTLAEAMVTHMRKLGALESSLADELRTSMELEAGRMKRFRRTARAAYVSREWKPVAVEGHQLSESGQRALELLQDVESHALEASPYFLDKLAATVDDYRSSQEALAAARDKAASGSAALAKLALVLKRVTRSEDEEYADFRDRVENALLARDLVDSEENEQAMRALRAWAGTVHKARKAGQRALARLDVLILSGFFQYSLDFQHLVVAEPMEAASPAEILRAPKTYSKRLRADLEAAGDDLAAAMVSYWPRHPFYAKARTAHKRYSGYDKDGSVPGWAVRGTVKRGSKGSKVIKLRQRLAAEGYYEGDMESSKFDPKLGEAVKRYQASHQLNVDGIVRNSHGLAGLTRTSLAVPMSQRARQLALSLQRWRESPSHKEGEDFYFRVNVPQFEVEVWDGDKQVRKHRIIVGNNKMEVDPDHGRKGHLNRTALISDDITTVVINPVWNIPARIKISEIMVEAAKDPEYLNKHGYRVRTVGGRQHIYQEAGPGNALGRVKLLFPNKHSIYMHDTPKKRLFKRTVRAFSHGCMRLHDPMDMATFLLERQDLMTGTEVQRVLATKKERGIRLKPSVPIHIEYNTIAFEPDSDNPIFLNDVYRYDRAYYDGKLPLQPFERIPIVKTETPDLIVDEEGRVIVPEPEPEPGVEGVDGVEGAEGVEGAPTEEAPAPVAQPDPEAKPEETPEPAPTAPLNEPGPDD